MIKMDSQTIVYEQRASYILYNIFKELGKGKVLMPANICPIVPATIIKAGATPEFIDIDLKHLTMEQDQLLETLQKDPQKYTGVIWVRTYGNNQENIVPLIEKVKSINKNLFFVDDQCLSVPSFEKPTTKADLTLYSTGYSKIAELDWGGYGILNGKVDYNRVLIDFDETKHDELQNIFREAINHSTKINVPKTDWLNGQKPKVSFEEYREMLMLKTEAALSHKKIINEIYDELLPNEIKLADSFQNWRFNIKVQQPARILAALFEQDLFASNHYAPVANLFSDTEAPNASKFHSQVVNLFNDFRYSPDMAEKTAKIILKNL